MSVEGSGPREPSLAACLRASLSAARSAWTPALWLPPALVAGALWAAALLVTPAAHPLAQPILACAAVLLVWPAVGLAATMAAWEFGRGERLPVSEAAAILRAHWRGILMGPLFVPLGAGLLAGLVLGGAALLLLLPALGRWLAGLWLLVPGLPLALLFAGLLLLGVPALPLIISAAAVETPFPFDAASRGMSYVRARPGRYAAMLLAGLGGATAGCLLFGVLLLLALVLLECGAGLVAGGPPPWSDLPAVAREVVARADPLWPFLSLSKLGLTPAEGALALHLPAWIHALAGRCLSGYALAAATAVTARTYLLLRWTVDGKPAWALVRAGEKFAWEAAEETERAPRSTTT